jgi:uncharacterized membrane-anchored protein
MYLDPGTTGLLVQGLFALIAGIFAFFRRAREFVALVCSRAVSRLGGFIRGGRTSD